MDELELGDLEQFEVSLLRRDREIDSYNEWFQEWSKQIEKEVFRSLVSWKRFEDYCIAGNCGKYREATRKAESGSYYQLQCGHYIPIERYDGMVWSDWDRNWVYVG